MTDERDRDANRLAGPSLAAGDPTGWFDRLYLEAADGAAIVPWDRGGPNPHLVSWADGRAGPAGTAVVVGCGLGGDSEYVATLGYDTTAFDVSPAGVAGARARYPQSVVTYEVASLFELPARWAAAFDLVVESHTVQSLPVPLHADATAAVRSLVAPGGTLLVIGAVGAEGVEVDGPPWPLTPAEVGEFARDGLVLVRSRQVPDASGVAARWQVELRREPAERVRLEAVVRGRVQGVGFRDWVRRRARDRSVVGSAVNRLDGGVDLVAEGARDSVQSLLDALRTGPTPGEVIAISEDWSAATGLDGFRMG